MAQRLLCRKDRHKGRLATVWLTTALARAETAKRSKSERGGLEVAAFAKRGAKESASPSVAQQSSLSIFRQALPSCLVTPLFLFFHILKNSSIGRLSPPCCPVLSFLTYSTLYSSSPNVAFFKVHKERQGTGIPMVAAKAGRQPFACAASFRPRSVRRTAVR